MPYERDLPATAPPTGPARAAPGIGKKWICHAFNAGMSGTVDTPCPRGFRHACVVCGDLHAAVSRDSCRAKVNEKGQRIKTKGAGKGGGKAHK